VSYKKDLIQKKKECEELKLKLAAVAAGSPKNNNVNNNNNTLADLQRENELLQKKVNDLTKNKENEVRKRFNDKISNLQEKCQQLFLSQLSNITKENSERKRKLEESIATKNLYLENYKEREHTLENLLKLLASLFPDARKLITTRYPEFKLEN